jgi:hypothetical protein
MKAEFRSVNLPNYITPSQTTQFHVLPQDAPTELMLTLMRINGMHFSARLREREREANYSNRMHAKWATRYSWYRIAYGANFTNMAMNIGFS